MEQPVLQIFLINNKSYEVKASVILKEYMQEKAFPLNPNIVPIKESLLN